MLLLPVHQTRIADVVETYLGTPFHHRGRVPGVGLDCVGILICAARSLGVTYPDSIEYDRMPNSTVLLAGLRESLDECRGDSFAALDGQLMRGDVIVFWISSVSKKPQHTGVFMEDGSFIHAVEYAPGTTRTELNCVMRTRFDPFWKARICGAFHWGVKIRG